MKGWSREKVHRLLKFSQRNPKIKIGFLGFIPAKAIRYRRQVNKGGLMWCKQPLSDHMRRAANISGDSKKV